MSKITKHEKELTSKILSFQGNLKQLYQLSSPNKASNVYTANMPQY